MYGSFEEEDKESSGKIPSNERMTSIKLVPINLSEQPPEDEVDGDEVDDDNDASIPIMSANTVHPEEKPEEKPLSDGAKTPSTFFDDVSIYSDELLSEYALHQAAMEGSIEFLKQIFKIIEQDKKSLRNEINTPNAQGLLPLHLAARHNKKDAIALLCLNGAEVNQQGGEDQFSPLHLAAKYDMCDAARYLLITLGADASLKNIYGSTALHFSARRGNLELCKMLIDQGVSPNEVDNSKATPLHMAMLGGNAEVVELLINNGAKVDAEDKEGERPIHFAAAENQGDLIALLVKAALHGIPADKKKAAQKQFIDAATNELDTALHVAAQAGYIDTVKTLHLHNANLNVRTDTRATPLHLASISGQLSVVRYLVMNGAKVNLVDEQLDTALHKACQFGRLEVVKFLKENGARIDEKDNENFTPLLCAVWKGQNEVVKFLLDSGAKIRVIDINMKTVLHLAIEEDWDDTLQLLMKSGADALVNAPDKDYRTPLHYAASMGNDEAIEMLLAKSAQVDCGDNEEKTPIHVAAEYGRLSAIKLLGTAAAGVINLTDDRGRTPLHLAAMKGNKRVCSCLIEMGAETSCRDDTNWTPLDYAAEQGRSKTVRLLLENDAPVDAMDKNKCTPLHHASANGHIDCISVLLDYGASISKQNNSGRNCLEIAVENFQRDACMAFIQHKRWREALKHANDDGFHPLEKLIEFAPEVAEIVLDRCVTYSKEDFKHKDYEITYNFEYVAIPPEDQKGRTYFAPENMVQHKRDTLLSHPLTVKLIDSKFSKLASWMYMLNLSVYLLFVALLTSLLVIDKERMAETGTKTSKLIYQEVVPWCTLLLALIQIGKEVVQLFYLRRHYFKDLVNYLEIILYSLTIVFMIPFIVESFDSAFNSSSDNSTTTLTQQQTEELFDLENIKWNAGSLAILIAWSNLLLYFKRFPTFGLYVVMFVEVSKTVLSVLSVFSIFIVAFALSFYVLMDETKAFRYVGRSIMKTAVMTIGEFEYSDTFSDNLSKPDIMPYKIMTYLIFCLFLVMMPILIMNLLVGLAIGDIEAVRNNAYLRILRAQVRILYTLERTYPKWLLGYTYEKEVIQQPNQKSWFKRLKRWLTTSDYDSLKEEQKESAGKEDIIMRELTSNREEVEKQKKRMKSVMDLLEDQLEMSRRIADKLGLEEED